MVSYTLLKETPITKYMSGIIRWTIRTSVGIVLWAELNRMFVWSRKNICIMAKKGRISGRSELFNDKYAIARILLLRIRER